MKKFILIICFTISFPAYIFSQEWKVEEKQVVLNCDCLLNKSEVLVKLQGDCSGNEFKTTEKAMNEYNRNRIGYVLSTWHEFVEFKEQYFISTFFKTISKDFFKENWLGVIYVSYTGSQFIKKESIYKIKQECGFAYEVWDQKIDPIPACIWSNLYLIKLKKQENL